MSSVPVLVRLSVADIVTASRILYVQCGMETKWDANSEILSTASSVEVLGNLLVEIGLPTQIAESGRDIEDFLPEFALQMRTDNNVQSNVLNPTKDSFWDAYAEKYEGDRLYPLPGPQWLAYMGNNDLLQIFPAHSKADVSLLTREDMIGKLFWCADAGWCTIIGPGDSLRGADTVEEVFREIEENYGAHEC